MQSEVVVAFVCH